jgi:hypothetical protein
VRSDMAGQAIARTLSGDATTGRKPHRWRIAC